MLNSKGLSFRLWAKAMNTAYYMVNRVYLRPSTKVTPYEIWKGTKPNLKYFYVFISVCYILNDREQRGKLDAKSDEGVFLGYSNNSRAYRVYNKRTQAIIESANVVVDNFKGTIERLSEDEAFNESERYDQGDEKHNAEDSVIDNVADGVITLPESGQSEPETEIYNFADPITRELSPNVRRIVQLRWSLEAFMIVYVLKISQSKLIETR